MYFQSYDGWERGKMEKNEGRRERERERDRDRQRERERERDRDRQRERERERERQTDPQDRLTDRQREQCNIPNN